MVQYFFDSVENIVGKEENAGYQHFLLFPQCFKRCLPEGRENQGLFGKKVNPVEKSLIRFDTQFKNKNVTFLEIGIPLMWSHEMTRINWNHRT